MQLSKYKVYGPFCWVLLVTIFPLLIPLCLKAQTDSLAFGDKKWISDGVKGDIYFLQAGTQALPDFDTMKSAGTIYAKKIDVPERSWTTGFPGVPDRIEWFAIVYNGSFKVKKPGHYTFRLLSDDGAKLYIDHNLVVDNDGVHGPGSRLGDKQLDGSRHSFRLEYFQGPQTQIALQLFATLDKETEQVFPGDNFILTTPVKQKAWICWLIYSGVGLIVLILLFLWFKRKRKVPAN
jgi:hypothetical protein